LAGGFLPMVIEMLGAFIMLKVSEPDAGLDV
jgi:hypothetical protein